MKRDQALRPEVLAELWQASGLKFKILFTLGMIFVVRFGVQLPVSGLDNAKIADLFNQGTLLQFVDLFAGGALAKFSILAMGILPYINASIIMQLMTSVIPKLEEMQKEGGEAGRRQIAQITRYLTIILASVQAFGMSVWLWRSGVVLAHPPGEAFPVLFVINTTALLVAGAVFVMWIGEQMTEHGIGNGASLLIFIGIVAAIPGYAKNTYLLVQEGASNWFAVGLTLLSYLLLIVAVVYASEGARKIPVQSAKRQVGNRMYGGRATYMPFRLNQGGVMPIIFASSVLLFPATIQQFAPEVGFLKVAAEFLTVQPGYGIFFVSLLFFFTFFYASMVLNPQEIAANLKRYGSYIPGYRPGRPTAEYLEKILNRMTLCGAVFLSLLVIFPMLVTALTGVTTLDRMGSTAILIMVGVAIDLFNQLQTHLLARQYEGFTT
ncbi:MAG: preprotein translocase subunit SecY [Candidatus Sericytochromatia bacterium]|nr:preprotein translocase subunit SecY [Candidatus Sericytochromatia bacterium]